MHFSATGSGIGKKLASFVISPGEKIRGEKKKLTPGIIRTAGDLIGFTEET